MKRASYREGLSFVALSFGSDAVLGVASAIITARIYGISVVGEYALAVATVNAIRLLSTAKERPALVRELSTLPPRAPRITGLVVATLAFSSALTAIVGLVASAVTYGLFSGPIGRPELFLPTVANVVAYVLIVNVSENMSIVLSSFRAGRELFWIRTHEAAAFIVVAVSVSYAGTTVWGLVLASTVSTASALVHRLVIVRRLMRFRVPGAEVREGFRVLPGMIKFGLKITPGSLADGVSNESGTWILGVTSPIATVGAWGRAWLMARRFFSLNQRVTEMLFPTLVERRSEGDQVGFTRALMDSLRYTVAGLLLPAAGAGGAALGVMNLFGPGFSEAAGALAILVAMPAVFGMSLIQRHALYSLDRPVSTAISGLLRMVVTLSVSIPLALLIGPTGVALGLLLGFVVDLGYMWRIVRPHLADSWRSYWTVRQAVGILAAYTGGFVAARVLYEAVPNLAGLIAALAAGSLVYVCVLIPVGGVNELDRQRFAYLLAAFRRRRGGAATARVGGP